MKNLFNLVLYVSGVTPDQEFEEISYKNLRRIQQQEQTLPSLTKIPGDFYQQLNSFTSTLEKNVMKENTPQKLKLYEEEIHNMKKLVNSIYELREKKIVQAALSTIRGAKPDLKNLIGLEKKLYETLINQINQTRTEIFQQTHHTPTEPEPVVSCEEKPIKKTNSNPFIRITADIPDFIGTDLKTYSLKKDDIVSLTPEMSSLLIKRNVACCIE